MVPSLGVKLTDEPGLFAQVWEHTSKVLQLDTIAVEEASVAAV
jgi:malate dehydrogenase (quinone)